MGHGEARWPLDRLRRSESFRASGECGSVCCVMGVGAASLCSWLAVGLSARMLADDLEVHVLE
ncbi:hypothetical protein ACFPRL_12715 [Pseudoclavibacter helvolus]